MKSLISTITIILAAFVSLGCSAGINNHQSIYHLQRISPEQPAPIVNVEINSNSKLTKPFEFKWSITNVGTEPIYIYSSLLKSSNFAEVVINPDSRSIEVRFLSLQPSPVTPYYFPSTEFIQIAPGQSQEGTFSSRAPTEKIVSYQSNGGKVSEMKITAGTWIMDILVAYGYEIESIKKPQNEGGHPINTIVKWQKIAYSNKVNVEFYKS
jgi:hypothetical protein